MLSIQPNFTNQAMMRKSPVFKGENDSISTPDESYYASKTDYYEKQVKDFENLVNDEKTAKPLKDIARVFKVVSEVLFNGWAVAWGASKGAKFVKTSVVDGVNSKFAKNAKEVLKPLGKSIVEVGEQFVKLVKGAVKSVKGSPLYTNISDRVSELATRMDGNKYGHIALNVLRKVRDGVVALADFVVKPIKKFAENVKNTPFDTAYDKVAKVTSTTLGVGAGAASGYNEIVHPQDAKVNDEAIVEDELPPIDELEEEV